MLGLGSPPQLTSLTISNLTTVISPTSTDVGVSYTNSFEPFAPATTSTTGFSAAPLLFTTDSSAVINISTAIFAPNNTGLAAVGIYVNTVGGNGTGGINGDGQTPPSEFSEFNGGAGGGGGDVTVNNLGNITVDSSARQVLSRAEEFGETGELGALPNDIQVLQGLVSQYSADPNDPSYFINNVFSIYQYLDGNSVNFSSEQAFIASLQQAIIDEQAREAYLSAVTSPEQTTQFIYGAIHVTSLGGNGGAAGGVPLIGFDYPAGLGGDGGAGGAITITNGATIVAHGDLVAGIYALSTGGQGGISPVWDSFGPDVPNAGFGGHGGMGGAVTVTNNGTIDVVGASSPGIFAESIGGVAGDGGPYLDSNPNYTYPGGNGGLVTVDNAGVISTNGTSAYGILAESLGAVGLQGGDAKPGGAGGDVVVDVSGQITTVGEYAYGVFGRSIGGNGGNGSDDDDGGVGGASGLVTITVDKGATITTSSDNAIGVFGQSQGGTGGFGGSGDNVFYSDAGGGGNGGQGGDVHLSNAGSIVTSGAYAYGMFGQALGGAGGYGGSAEGLVSESGGGGGGTGAGNVVLDNSGSITTSGVGANALYGQSVAGQGGDAGSSGGFVALGSDGGSGAQSACEADPTKCLNGGMVTATNEGALTTQGDSATAIFAQSIGGGGGNGGSSSGVFSFGGSGGAGGNGGTVQVTNAVGGTIDVSGNNGSMGVFAESVGGGGGNGGDSFSAGTSVNVSIGGSGGSGGMGGAVTVANNGAITLNGYNDTAIFVQSVGGGGGNGGDATAFGVGITPASLAIGGSGGGGGNGGTVMVTNNGTIATTGDFSNAIFAQSVGGGGGHGGAAYTFSAAAGGDEIPAVSVAVSLGGNGADGGQGGEVDVTNSGTITTLDWNAVGIFAQSVGGSGGDGGSSSAEAVASAPEGFSFTFSLAVGGNGGNGNISNPVSVTNLGSIATFGDLSPAIFAQSVGGSGGNGGDGSASSTSLLSKNSVDVDISVGGKGGAGGDGSTASVQNSGSILTMGAMSPGITAQSVGGGGGNGGDGEQGDLIPGEADVIPKQADVDGKVDDALKKLSEYQSEEEEKSEGDESLGKKAKAGEGDDEGPDSFGLTLTIGGSGGAAGDGKLAYVDNNGDITTLGWMSNGISAQSVGGGGGNGGDGNGMGADSVNGSISIGGNGAASGMGGTVDVINTGDVTTYGDISFGIMAQSVGGGGGSGGSGSAYSAIDPNSFSLDVSIGGRGGAAGNGGSVSVQQTGDILTLGLGSIGIFAESVGGGGGSAGSGIADEFNLASVHVGGQTGAGGDGLDVTVTLNAGSIETTGDYAHAIFAQSVGGGGGMVGEMEASALVMSDPFGGLLPAGTPVPYTVEAIATSGPSSGDGGPIVVQATGTIATYGKDSYGIFAQSVAGGGGVGPLVGYNSSLIGSDGGSGTAKTITITQSGSIIVSGQDSIGIFAQSMDASGRGGDITVQVNGIVQGGFGAGAGIFLSGGNQNTLTINAGSNVSALSGLAIIASDGDDTVDNFGTVTGDVGLGAGANAMINEASGVFESGPLVYLGAGNTLTNKGTLSPGGTGTIATTTIVGNYVQTSTGTLVSDVNFTTGASDLVVVNGNASLAGKAALGPNDITAVKPGEYFTVLTTTGTLINNGITIDNTLTVDYGVKFVGSNFEVGVNSVQFDFGGPLTPKEQIISNNIQAIWAAGGGGMTQLLDYLAGLTNANTYQQVLDHLDPSTGLGQRTASLFSGVSAINSLMSCPGTENAAEALHEHECFWARTSGSVARQGTTASTAGYKSSGYEYAMGEQLHVAPGWFAGASADLEQSSSTIGTLARASSFSVNAGAVAKHETENWLFAGAVDVRYGANSLTRFVNFPTPNTNATSSPDTLFADGRLRAAYLLSQGDVYLKPWVAADGYVADGFGFQEQGAGPLDLIVAQSTKTFGSGTVGVETGLVESFLDESSLRTYVSAEVTAYTDNSWDITARFAGAPPGTPDFTVSDKFPGVLARIVGGLEVNVPGGSIRLEYENRFGDHYSDQTGSLKLRFPL
jgi:hypothetical protein